MMRQKGFSKGWLTGFLAAALLVMTSPGAATAADTAGAAPGGAGERGASEPHRQDGEHRQDDTYSQEEILAKAEGFFGATTEGLAKAIQKVFEDQGRPNGYITGEEASGAIGVGLRYGKGHLNRKAGNGAPGGRPVFWQGPSIGFDFGGNASKVFVLVYHLNNVEALFQRYPGVDGSFYFVAGVGVNYQQSGEVILAPIRTGVGLRAGANIGYLHYTKKHSWVPL